MEKANKYKRFEIIVCDTSLVLDRHLLAALSILIPISMQFRLLKLFV